MSTTLMVIEDRILLAKMISYFDDYPHCQLRFVINSCNTTLFFTEVRPQLLVVDVAVSTSYLVLLDAIDKLLLDYHVILLIDHESQCQDSPHITTIYKDALSKPAFLSHLDSILHPTSVFAPGQPNLRSTNSAVHKYSIGSITVIYARNLNPIGHSMASQQIYALEDAVRSFCAIDSFSVEDGHLIFAIDADSMAGDFNFAQIGHLIYSHVGRAYAVFYWERTSYEQLQTLYHSLDMLGRASYFCQGNVVDIQTLQEPPLTTAQMQAIDTAIAQLSVGIWDNDVYLLQTALESIFRQIKESRCSQLRGYGVHLLTTTYNLLASTVPACAPMPHNSCNSCESEFAFFLEAFSALRSALYQAHIPHTCQEVLSYLLGHYNLDVSLSDVSDYVHSSKSYVSRICKEYLSGTFLQLLSELKLQKANYLLRNTQYKISIISQCVGFTDTHYFSRLYKKRMGTPPQAYRNTSTQTKEDAP